MKPPYNSTKKAMRRKDGTAVLPEAGIISKKDNRLNKNNTLR
jgi:hypothetical protein